MTEKIKLTINDVEVTVDKGTSVIQAAMGMGTEIPHFCWHEGLSVAGVCRFCMVKIEGMPKLQIACNTTCTEGMKVYTKTQEVEDAHKWALEFHLINHPLDCPICDQAGECGLQNYYMKVGKYDSQMEERKVLKPKALDVGDTLVLDTERCILCSRCVRFEDEVTKTSSLGIFNRGDEAVIGTFPDKRINHNYSYNLADICPVGAFTAKDFRFKCRVWFLKETETICPGCSTGCNVTLFENSKQREYYRLKPRKNEDVNGHWMCDYGRTMFEHLNSSQRIATPFKDGKSTTWQMAKDSVAHLMQKWKDDGKAINLVLTPQYTNEEYQVILQTLKSNSLLKKVFVWRSADEKTDDFDGILLRGDRNSNTKGLEMMLKEQGISATIIKDDFSAVKNEKDVPFIIFAPEIEKSYKDFGKYLQKFSELSFKVLFSNSPDTIQQKFDWVIPTLTFAEKNGTFVNFKGIEQKLKANPPVFPQLKSLHDFFAHKAH